MVAIAKESVLLGLDDCKISPLTVDNADTLTYGTAIDVPGITQLELSPTFMEKQLKGDESVLDTYSKLEQIDWSIEHGKISLDALALWIGGAVVAGGVTPNQTQTFTLKNTDLPGYFKLEAKTDYADVGDAHFILFKAKCTSFSFTIQGEEYATISASGKAIGTLKDKKIKDIVFNETAVDITTGSAPGALTVTTSPADGGASVAVDSNITWTFSNAISPSDVSAANFTVTKSDGTAVTGTLSIDSTRKIVSFDPTSNLDASSTYIAIATIGVHDIYGQTLAANTVIGFGTA